MNIKYQEKSGWAIFSLTRFLLSFIVVCVHLDWFYGGTRNYLSWVPLLGGKAAVIGFLFVSGYSIAASFAKNPQKFYRRRLYRIYPTYMAALLFSALVEQLTPAGVRVPQHTFETLGLATLAGNFVFLQTFLVSAVAYNVAIWSLAIEIAYYTLAPLFKKKLSQPIIVALISISAISFVIPTNAEHGLFLLIFTKLKFIKYMWCWLIGFLVYGKQNRIFVVVSAFAAFFLTWFSEETPEIYSCWIVVIAFLVPLYQHKKVLPTELIRIFNYLGDLSYPLYLFHLPAMVLLYFYVGERDPLLFIGVVFAIGLVVLHLIEYYLKPRFLYKYVIE